MEKIKSAYCIWFAYYQTLPKVHRHSIGVKSDRLFVDIIEATSTAGFLPKEEKLPWVKLAVRKTDTLKIMSMILWQLKSLDNNKFINLSQKIDDFGRDLGGWHNRLAKENSPDKTREK